MSRVACALIRCYQLTISPMLGARCRFSPSCSEYTALAIERDGLVRGTWLGVRRLCRCHPWGESGFDPLP